VTVDFTLHPTCCCQYPTMLPPQPSTLPSQPPCPLQVTNYEDPDMEQLFKPVSAAGMVAVVGAVASSWCCSCCLPVWCCLRLLIIAKIMPF
jgi:hypothetical protein